MPKKKSEIIKQEDFEQFLGSTEGETEYEGKESDGVVSENDVETGEKYIFKQKVFLDFLLKMTHLEKCKKLKIFEKMHTLSKTLEKKEISAAFGRNQGRKPRGEGRTADPVQNDADR